MFRRVALIGGGAAAATLLSELLDRPATQPLHLDWYTGDTGALARGVAYGTHSARHLLNVRAASMSMFAGKPRGFLDFAQRGDASIAGTDFLPRQLYGDYLEAEVNRALELARAHGHDVHLIAHAVDAVVPESDGVNVICGENSAHVDAAVLALGALPPQPLGGVAQAALDSGRYVVDPWRFLAAAQPDSQPRKVVLIGLGLTAVDVLLELSALWPNAEFTAVSRHGLFPEAHLSKASAPTDDGAELVEQMLEAPEVRSWTRLLRDTTARSTDWRTVVDGLRPHLSALWAELPPPERARFMRHARWAWERVRHRLPPQVEQAMHALEQSDRLHRLRGRMRDVELASEGLRLNLQPNGDGSAVLPADYVIQTVGLNTDARRTGHPLVRQLVTNGHVAPDPLGLGCDATADGHLRHKDGTWPHLFAIGSLLRGTLWESTAMPEIRVQARHLADILLAP